MAGPAPGRPKDALWCIGMQQWSVEDGRRLEFLAGDGGPDDGENAGANDGADAKRRQAQPAEGFLQAEFGAFTIGNELVDILAGEQG